MSYYYCTCDEEFGICHCGGKTAEKESKKREREREREDKKERETYYDDLYERFR